MLLTPVASVWGKVLAIRSMEVICCAIRWIAGDGDETQREQEAFLNHACKSRRTAEKH